MILVSAKVGPFKSIEQPTPVAIDPQVTVLVGMNESGKTAFLQALHKSNSVDSSDAFDPVEDYPRRSLTSYLKKHETDPAVATVLTYRLSDTEVAVINTAIGTALPKGYTFSVSRTYKNSTLLGMQIDEAPVVTSLAARPTLSSDAKSALKSATSIRDSIKRLDAIELTEADQALLAELTARAGKSGWTDVVDYEIWHNHLSPRLPRYLYFDDYHVLPGKINLADLQNRSRQAPGNPTLLTPPHRGVLALLRMADIALQDLANPDGYETIKAKLEGISNSITDQVFRYWRQNENLEVEFDIRADPNDEAPYNNGPNLYIRIRNKRHRVTVPFDQRSKGFIWFFSFLVWFDSIQHQVGDGSKLIPNLILLLDEPGLSLHALAQADFLAYIDELADEHQVVYSTHSPFMVHSDRLHQVRVVEDREGTGTVVSANVNGSSSRTLFPLQAALGYSIAQNLFIGKRNLLIEGAADLVYLQFVSAMLDSEKREGLRDDVVLMPTGGLDKVATFVALLGANDLELVVLHDAGSAPDTRIATLVRERILPQKAVLTYAAARSTAPPRGKAQKPPVPMALLPTDVEDLFEVKEYLDMFNAAFAGALPKPVKESDLPPGDRIVDRLNRYLHAESITLRPSGGFNHYTVANYLAGNPPSALHMATLSQFELLFKKLNTLFSAHDTPQDDEGA